MPKIAYIEKRFSVGSLKLIETANEIIEEYKAQGFSLTLRQLYYQFVSRDIIENKMSEYKRLGSIVNDARLAGHIDWYSIEDRTRWLRKLSSWSSPREILDGCAQQYRADAWGAQDAYLEVWIEKDALTGVIEGICDKWRVPYFACKGNNSQSEQWRAGRRLKGMVQDGKDVHILYLGDHDPTGMDITRDNQERLTMFGESDISLHRLALNMDQVEKYNPPPNPVKEADSRASGYTQKYGESCWELDALEPKVISKLIEKKILKYLDTERWEETMGEEELARAKIKKIAEKF